MDPVTLMGRPRGAEGTEGGAGGSNDLQGQVLHDALYIACDEAVGRLCSMSEAGMPQKAAKHHSWQESPHRRRRLWAVVGHVHTRHYDVGQAAVHVGHEGPAVGHRNGPSELVLHRVQGRIPVRQFLLAQHCCSVVDHALTEVCTTLKHVQVQLVIRILYLDMCPRAWQTVQQQESCTSWQHQNSWWQASQEQGT